MIGLFIFVFFLAASLTIGILMETGIVPSTGMWGVQYEGDFLQGVLVASTTLLAVNIVFILHMRTESTKRSSPDTSKPRLATQWLSWSILAGVFSILGALCWFSYADWVSMLVSMYMFIAELVMTLSAVIGAKLLKFW